jgi:phosphomannomutase/phosphoglucomutase
MPFTVPSVLVRTIFRVNDIRGNTHNELTSDVVYAIGLAFGSEMVKSKEQKVILAQDGRLSSPGVAKALTQGLKECGIDIIDLGAVPTPFLYFATHVLKTSTGIMITGSHNPSDDNGLKIILRGEILTEAQLDALYDRINTNNFSYNNKQGNVSNFSITDSYYSEVLSRVKLKRKLRVVVDCGNGIVGKFFPDLARKMGCEIIELYCKVDGTFPNHFPDPSILKNMTDLMKSVADNKADLGVAFDGDGDRLGTVTDKGEIIYADRVLMLFSKQVLNDCPKSIILYDVKCTRLLDKWIKDLHGVPLMWKTGHSLIEAKMGEVKAKLAGEMSGHFYFVDRWYGFDDGLYSAARLLEILSQEGVSSSQVFSQIPNSISTPELRINFSDEEKFKFIDKFKQQATFKNCKLTTIDGLRADFDFGFGLVRASNTTPCLILRFEADTKANLKKIQEMFRVQMLAIDPKLQMPF